jgi:hypothetical protein
LLGGLLGALSRAAVQRGGKEISDDRRGGTDERLARAIQPVGPGSVGIRALSWSAVAGKADTLCEEIIRRTRWRVLRPAVVQCRPVVSGAVSGRSTGGFGIVSREPAEEWRLDTPVGLPTHALGVTASIAPRCASFPLALEIAIRLL